MSNVSALATVFGIVGLIPFAILLLVTGILWTGGLASGLPVDYVGWMVLGGLAACFALSGGYLLAWGVLRALCEICGELRAMNGEPR